MRRSLFALTIAIVLVVSAQFGQAQDLVVSRFRDYLESLRVQAGIPALAATIVGSNHVIWQQGFGRQDIDRAIAATPATPFQFDGVTQVFTAAIVLRCVEEGRLSLDDQLGQYSPKSPDANATIQQLLSHTSGSPDNLV